jgi:hypothetical protein
MVILIVAMTISYEPKSIINVNSKNVNKSDACVNDESVFYNNNLFVRRSRVKKIMWSTEPALYLIVTCGRLHLPVKIRF